MKNKRRKQKRMPIYTIFLEKPVDEEEGPRARCTCDWTTPYSTNLISLGNAAFKHAEVTGHKLRQH